MSYQVIARKYRPQTFSDLTGQEHITRTLTHALENRRLHHAYLFSGVRGTGKTTTARILAKGLNCLQGITSKPCLQCPSCLEIASGNSLDVLEIDAASNTGVDNVREVIINNLALAPARDRYKIFVIDEVHMLSTSAFNALLKTLEEPPSHVIFIMATTELHKVPDTILSRCQQFEFHQIATEKILHRLREIAVSEGIEIDEGALREIARAGAGSLRDAQSYFDQVIAAGGAQITAEDVSSSLGRLSAATLGQLVEAIARQDTPSTLNLIEEISSRGYDLRNVTHELMAYLRHLLVVKSGIVNGEILGVADIEIDRLRELARHFSEEDLVRCFHQLAQTEREIKDSPHPRFQLEIGLVKLTHATRLRTLDELIGRLQALEARLQNEGGDEDRPAPPPPAASVTRRNPENATDEIPRGDTDNGPGRKPEFAQRRDSDAATRAAASPVKISAADTPANSPAPASPAINEVEAVRQELQRMNRGLVLTALEDAQKVEYHEDVLQVTFGSEDLFARRLRDSNTLFREIGERLFGRPLRVEVRIESMNQTEQVDEAELARRKLHERAMKNPAVRRLLEQTRGEIVWVKEN
ncbi:MAG: DNA polymerase III subunit gamma/tau [Blastocatellia bacterium]|nr:DNA polymerase III subunit gamma/tau [Blastocatellia bacterium]